MKQRRYLSFMIAGLSVMHMSACASNKVKNEQIDLQSTQTIQPDENLVIELPEFEKVRLSQRIMKSATQGTISTVNGVASVVKNTAHVATKGTITGVRMGSEAASEANEFIIEGTKRTAKGLEKGVDFIITAPAANDAASPVGHKTLTDAALSPLSDFNIRKRERPEVLMRLQDEDLYFIEEDVPCNWYDARIHELDNVLGDDYDVSEEGLSNLEKMNQAGKGAILSSVASAAGTYVPGRGMIRSLSGAKARQKKTRQIYQKGVARRAFLTGVATAKGCDGY